MEVGGGGRGIGGWIDCMYSLLSFSYLLAGYLNSPNSVT